MKWMFLILFLTSGRYDAGVDIELFRFYTQKGCEEARYRLERLETLRGTNINRNGFLVFTECFSEE